MPIVVSCACGRRLQIDDEYAGGQGQCPACGRVLDLPVAEADSVASPNLSEGLTAQPAARASPPPERPAAASEVVEVRNHGGDPLPADADFFVPPPPEIGAVVSAYSTLRGSARPRPAAFRAGLALLVGGGALLFAVLLVALARPRSPVPYVLFPLLAGLVAAGAAVLLTRFRHGCTYVGRDGVACFRCAGDRDRLTLTEVFLFRNASELRTSQTRQFVNGIYTGTDYAFTWTDVGGRKRYLRSGRYKSQQGTPKSTDAYHFARAAEIAWSNYLLPNACRQLDLSGAVLFMLNKGNWIRVTPTGLVLHFGGNEEEWDAREIARVSVDAGVIRIKRHGAREGWFSSSGVFKFDFTSLGNAQLFFFLVEKVLGVSVG